MTAWCLWNQKNSLHFGWSTHPISSISSVAGSLLQDLITVQYVEPALPQSAVLHRWCPPEPSTHKVNFDAAVFKNSNLAGIGVIVRDWRGVALGALSMPTLLSSSVADMEALACRRVV